jgi:hypothetical protein
MDQKPSRTNNDLLQYAWGHKYSSRPSSYSCKYLGEVLVTVIFPHKDMFPDKEFMFSYTTHTPALPHHNIK